MNYLFLSVYGAPLGVAYDLCRCGDSVRLFYAEDPGTEIGNGMIETVSSWRPHLDWADVIFCDSFDWAQFWPALSLAKTVMNTAPLMEILPEKSIEVFRSVGVEYRNTGTSLAILGLMHPEVGFCDDFLFFSEGENDCVGRVVSRGSRVVEDTLLRLETPLKRLGYLGSVGMQIDLEEENVFGVSVLENMSCRALEAMLSVSQKNVSKIFREWVAGELRSLDMMDEIVAGVYLSCSIPAVPIAIQGAIPTYYPLNVRRDGKQFVSVREGPVGTVFGTGASEEEAASEALSMLKKMHTPALSFGSVPLRLLPHFSDFEVAGGVLHG